MKFNIDFSSIARFIPSVERPVYKLTLKKKITWTLIILILYYALSHIRIYAIGDIGERFRTLEVLLGSKFGTLMSLGIGPIVTASMLLQLLVGSKIIDWDLSDPEDRKKFDTTNKLLTLVFLVIYAITYVIAGAVPPASKDPLTIFIVISQLALGGFLVVLMDDVVSKWGIGSGISLFIAAGVIDSIFIRALTPFTTMCFPGNLATCIPSATNPPSGLFWNFLLYSFAGDLNSAIQFFLPIISTVLVFLIVIYAQDISVDIPLTFGSVRGFGRRWGLKLFYTSNIPIILTAALLANIQLWGKLGMDPETNCSILACFDQNGRPISGILFYITSHSGIRELEILMLFLGMSFTIGIFLGTVIFKEQMFKSITVSMFVGFLLAISVFYLLPQIFSIKTLLSYAVPMLTYTLFMCTCATIFSIFWVNTAGMDPESIAEQIGSIGMQIPGYRRGKSIIKNVLEKYIPPLAVIGGISIGLLASFADFTGALGTGTGILLTVSIIYNFYEQIKTQHGEEAAPIFERFLGKK